ncbi:hypothetical protein D3C86_1698630 [compost metagenome]
MVDGGDDPLRLCQRWCHGPALVAVVTDAHHAGMGRQVAVDFRDGIIEAKPVAQSPDVGGGACQKLPARQDTLLFDVLLEVLRSVDLGLQGNRVHENILPHTLTQHLLHFAQIGGHGRAGAGAHHIHHIDGNDLATHQIVVEPHLLALMGIEPDVREIARR